MSSDNHILEARDMGRYDSRAKSWLLRAASLAIQPGERLAVVGPTGSGKTLLLRALALLDPLDAGTLVWNRQPIRNEAVPSFRRQVIYLQQRPVLFDGSVQQNLQLPFTLKAHAKNRFDRSRIVNLLAELGGRESFLEKSHRDLSGGEAQMMALLRVIQLDPTVILLDEPTAALDHTTTRKIEHLVDCWQGCSPSSRAFVWVTHDLQQAHRVANRMLRMASGHLQESG